LPRLTCAFARAEGRSHDATVLHGGAEAQWQASGALRYAPERAAYVAEVALVQAELPADEFAAAWAERLAMSREQAVNCALDLTRAPEMDTMAAGTHRTDSLS
jgi:hypothetical protein